MTNDQSPLTHLNTDLSAVLSAVACNAKAEVPASESVGTKAEHWLVRRSLGEGGILNTLFLILFLAFAGTAQAQTYDWTGNSSVYMTNAANWTAVDYTNRVPTIADIARWNAASYGNQPSNNVGGSPATVAIGKLLFGSGNVNGVTINARTYPDSWIATYRIDGVGLQVDSGSGPVTINSPLRNDGGAGTGTPSRGLKWVNNGTQGLFLNQYVLSAGSQADLFLLGSGDTTIGGSTANAYLNFAGGFYMYGTGTLTLTGTVANIGIGTLYVNSGTVLLAKTGGAINAGPATGPLTIGTYSPTAPLVKYAGNSTDMLGSGAITINGAGQLDFNGATDTIAGPTINTWGAGGNTTPIKNTAGGGNITLGTLFIRPDAGYTTTVDFGTGTGTVASGVETYNVANGTPRITGNLNLGPGTISPDFSANANVEVDNELVIDAVISGSTTATLEKQRSGRLVLGGANTYQGPTLISNGILTITNSAALGTTDNGTTVGNGLVLELAGGITVGAETLSLTGSGSSFYNYGALRNVSGNNSWGGKITIPSGDTYISSESGTLTIDVASGDAIAASGNLFINGAGNVTVNDPISGSGYLAKLGGGTLTLAGANTYSGLTALERGTLVLDYSTQNNSKLANGSELRLRSGTLDLSGGNHTEVVSAVWLNEASFRGAVAVTRSSGSSVLRMNTITRTAPGTIDFSAASIADCDNANTAGILGAGYATVAGADWASNSLNGADGPIVAFAGYQANSAGSTASISPNNADNVTMSAGDTTLTAGDTVNSLRFNDNLARTLTINNTITLNNTSGGILVTPSVGAFTTTINGAGTISAGGADLKIHQYNTGGTLTIDAIVGGSGGLTKTGPGTLSLGGSGDNSFGTAYIYGGTVELNKSGTAKALPGAVYIGQNGVVKITGSSTNNLFSSGVNIYGNGQIDINGKTNAIISSNSGIDCSAGASGNTTPIKNSTPGGYLAFNNYLLITPASGYNTLLDSGSGTIAMYGNLTVGSPVAGNGTVQIRGNFTLGNGSSAQTISVGDGDARNDLVIDAAISGNAGLLKSGAGRLLLGGANTYSGQTTVSGGFVTLTNSLALGASGAGNDTTVGSGFTLELQGGITVTNEPLTLAGVGLAVGGVDAQYNGSVTLGALRNVSGNNCWSGTVTLATADVRINSDAGTLTIGGYNPGDAAITGSKNLTIGGWYGKVTINDAIPSGFTGTLTKDGLGTLELGGSSANSYTNTTIVNYGALLLSKTSGQAIAGNLTIGAASDRYGYATVQYAAGTANTDMLGTGTVTINRNGILDFNGATDTIGPVIISNTDCDEYTTPIINTAGGGTLTIGTLTITPRNQRIATLDSGTGTIKLGGTVSFTGTQASAPQARILGNLDLNGARTFDVALPATTADSVYELDIAAVAANGSLTKTGAGKLRLSGASTYAGNTLVSAGTLLLASTGSITNSPNVTVGQSATLQTDSANALGTNATLALVSNGLNANYGKANLNFSGTQTVAVLRFDGVTQAGTWGSTNSTAANKTNNWFSGTGVILVNGPQIQNEAVTNVTATAATFNGWLVSNGPATVGVLWGTTDGGSGDWANTNWFDGTVASGTHLSTNISPLTTGTPYYYTFVASNASVVVRAAPSVAFVPQAGTTKTWLTTGTTDWGTSANWTPAGVPDGNCNVIINTAGGNQPVLNLSGGPVTIRSLSIGATAGSSLTFQNGDVLTKRLIVTNDVVIGANGTLTHVLGTAHALYLDISNNFSIASGGSINVDAKGDSALGAPGTGTRAGAGHGGEGASSSTAGGGTTYGSITNPVLHGSTGLSAIYGGGVVMLRVGGNFANNGTITANGGDCVSGNANTGGSGGSINLTVAGAMTMPSSASISAKGGLGDYNDGANESGGGGGRIAVLLTGVGQTFDNVARGKITAYGGSERSNNFTGPDPGGVAPFAGAGTVYLKTQAQSYGDVIVDNSSLATYHVQNGRTLLKDYSYRFGSITLTNRGEFVMGTGAALDLSGCTLRGDSTTNSIGSRLIVGAAGSAVTWSSAFTNTACISWTGTNGVSGTGDVTVTSGGMLTHEYGSANAIKLSLAGDLTLDAGSAVWAKGLSDFSIGSPSVAVGGSHGGVGEKSDATRLNQMPTYGSITNPVTPGGRSPNESSGGGVAIIRASGIVTLNSYINVNGDGSGRGGGAGGSVNIVAAELRGNGSISANGSIGTYANLYGGAGGGGRIAVVLTNSMTFTNVSFSAVSGGGCFSVSPPVINGYDDSGAGTIYLKGTNQAYGLLIVSNNTSAASESTLINTQVTDAVVGDVRILGTAYTRLALSNDCTLTVYGSWSNAVATNAISGGSVVFAGKSPDPVTIWGGNTWSNLTIETAGKTVNFEAGKTQFVYGAAAFSNVTLQSTSAGNYWYLLKPGVGTQHVGRVTVLDSNATNGWTFSASGGSGLRTVNWQFPPSGSVLLVW